MGASHGNRSSLVSLTGIGVLCTVVFAGTGFPEPDMSNRRCGTCCGASDTTSQMCWGATWDGELNEATESEVMARCAVDGECGGYGFSTTAGGYFRPVKSFSSLGSSDIKWDTVQKVCQ